MKNKEINVEKLTKVLKDFLIPILSVLIIFVLTLTVFRPTLTNWGKLNLENNGLRKRLHALSQKAKKLQNLDEEELKNKVKLVENVFPSQELTLPLLTSITFLGQQSKVIIEDIRLEKGASEASPSAKQEELVISFNIWGNKTEIISFFDSFNKTAPLMRIKDIEVKGSGVESLEMIQEKKLTGNIYLTLKVAGYYQLLPENLGLVDQPLPMLGAKEEEVFEEISDYLRPAPASQPVPSTTGSGRENLFVLE